jgi:hypothetical protein
MSTLEEFLQKVNLVAESEFYEEGCCTPTYVVITPDGMIMMPMPDVGDKDFALFLVRKALAKFKAIAYVFYDEAWVLQAPEGMNREDMPTDLRNHPDRKEILHLAAEDYQSGFIIATRAIIREEEKPAKLGPLEMETSKFAQYEGRMIGLLPPRGRKN